MLSDRLKASAAITCPENVPQWSTVAQLQGVRQSMLDEKRDTWIYELKRSDGINYKFRVALNRVTRAIVELIDGKRTIGEIVRAIVAESRPRVDAEVVWRIWSELFEILQGFDFVFMRHMSVPRFDDVVTRAA